MGNASAAARHKRSDATARVAHLATVFPGLTPRARAGEAIDAYIDAARRHEFGYVDWINPAGQSKRALADDAAIAQECMLDALASLDEQTVAELLDAHPMVDHDGSRFRATDLETVRHWARKHGYR